MTDEVQCSVHQGEVQTALIRAMCDALPNGGWSSCIVEYRKAARVAESVVKLHRPRWGDGGREVPASR
ncbi:Uncharacterised protein [Mycobacteroides abscessus subsp. massiliense]|nr:Uncharacterised protein [Mycobacteroides abscessus subsp. massiliense]